MTEIEYQHECSRAELLGIPKPTWEEFLNSRKNIVKEENEEEEMVSTVEAEEKEARKEGFKRIGGGFDELNSILSNTQKKLNRFKTVCGSFSNLLKIHVGSKKADEGDASYSGAQDQTCDELQNQETTRNVQTNSTPSHQYTKGDTQSELDKLDSLINKAEKAELSLSSQNKQMKKFLT